MRRSNAVNFIHTVFDTQMFVRFIILRYFKTLKELAISSRLTSLLTIHGEDHYIGSYQYSIHYHRSAVHLRYSLFRVTTPSYGSAIIHPVYCRPLYSRDVHVAVLSTVIHVNDQSI